MLKKKYDIVISDAALVMLDSHMDFLARVSKNAALKAIDEILGDIESLSENPQRFSTYENQFSKNHYRKRLSAKRYLIIYEVSEDTVFVDYIVDCRQDYGWLIR